MWTPRTWDDITAMIGVAEEAGGLDFKRTVGGNAEVAKDMAAMTLNGGVLIYGLDEDPATGLASQIVKQPLKGAEERLRQIAGSRIEPAPELEVTLLRENPADADGVIVVTVPASASAPHMVGDRYPTRHGTTTGYLSEREVARFYDRRRQLLDPALLQADPLGFFSAPRSVDGDPNGMVRGVGRLRVVVRPVADTVVHPAHPWLSSALQDAYEATVGAIIPRLSWELRPQELERLGEWVPRGTIGWTTGASGGNGQLLLQRTTTGAVLSYPSTLSFQGTWPLPAGTEGGGGDYYFAAHEDTVALALAIDLAFAGAFLSQIDGVGPVLCGVQLDGFEGAVSTRATRNRRMDVSHLPTATDATSTTIASVTELQEFTEVARRLIDLWLVPFYEMEPIYEVLFS